MVETRGTFHDPPGDSRPMVRWWWPCVDVEKEELLKEMADLDEMGFLGAEIQAFAIGMPLNMRRRDKERHERCHRFLHPYYYEMVSCVLEEARKRSMIIDLTVCSGWPAGGTHVSREDSLQMLIFGQKTLNGARRYRGPVPGAKKPPFYRMGTVLKLFKADLTDYYPEDLVLTKVVAARPVSRPGGINYFKPRRTLLDPGSLTDLTGKVDKNGILEWEVPEGTWQVFAFYSGSSGSKPLFPAKEEAEKESLVIDHLSSGPVTALLKRHFGRGKAYFDEDYFGRTLRGFFTDSLELVTEMMWTGDFIREFRERRGYDLTPFLPVLFVPFKYNKYVHVLAGTETPCFDIEEDNTGDRVRYDYELTVSDLFTERFVKTMADWGDKNRLKSRIQAYGIRADTLKAYGLSHTPETEQLYAGGIMDFLKIAGSAAIIYDKPLVTAETMVWNRRDFKTTPQKWKVAADRLFAAGVNQLIYHGFPYRDPNAECPESYPFSSPHVPELLCFSDNFSSDNPFRDYFPLMNTYITRCQHILQQGKTVCKTGVFFPAFNYSDTVVKQEELTGGYLDENDAPMTGNTIGGTLKEKLNTEDEWLKSQVKLGDKLSANGYYYTHINEERILDGRVEDGKLITGSAELEVIIFNNIRSVSLPLARKLGEISEAGVRIIFIGCLPEKQPGYHNHRINDPRIKEIMREMNDKEKAFIAGENPVPFLKVKGVLPDVIFEQEQPYIHYIHKKTGESDYYFIRSGKNRNTRLKLSFPQGYRTPFILDPWTGEVSEAPVYERAGDYIIMELDFDPFDSYLVEFRNVNAVKTHIISGDLRVTREEDRLVAYTGRQGKYQFTLKSGEIKKAEIGSLLPDPLEITGWYVETEYRDHKNRPRAISMKMKELKDWTQIPELAFCSARGVYTARFTLDGSYIHKGINLLLALGRVGDVAVVKCNDTELDPLLMQPYETDITPHVSGGENSLEITVVPTLNNQLIGYGRQGAAAYKNHRRKKSFMPSGLIGPVLIIPRVKIVVT